MALGNGMSFIFDSSKGETPQSVARKRALAAAIMGQMGNRSAKNTGEGIGNALASIGNGISANVLNRRADKAETAGQESANPIRDAIRASLMGEAAFPAAPGAPDNASQRVAQAHGGGSSGNYRDAIASVESAGSGDYAAVGPTHPKLGRALGRYQVMEANIGPWSKAALGREVSADEFMANPQLQDAIFDHQFGSYVQKYGNPQDAASAWFTGQPLSKGANRRDVLGTSGAGYVGKFNRALGPQGAVAANAPVATSQPVQTASLDPSIGMGGVSDVPPEYAATGLSPEQWQAMNAPDGGIPQPLPINEIGVLQSEGHVPQPQFSTDGKGDRLAMAPGVDPGAPGAVTDAGQRVLGQMMNPQPMGGPPMAMQGMPQPQQIAQAAPPGPDMSQLPVMAGGSADAIQPGQQGQVPMEMLYQALSNPFVDEGTKSFAMMMLKQQLAQQDPSNALDMEYKRAQIGALNTKAAGGNTEYGLNPIYGEDENGKPVLGTLGKDGTFKKIDTGGVQIQNGMDRVDLGTQWGLLNKRTGQIEGYMPKDLAGAEAEKAKGKGEGEAAVAYKSMRSKMPGLEKVVEELGQIADQATYTLTGRGIDAGMRELGMEPRESAVARTKYISMVDNQILPLLRDTFGAQFTQVEGESLKKTLGDPNKSPVEKKEVLNAFIEQKRRDVEALALQSMGGGEQPTAAPQSGGVVDYRDYFGGQ